MKLVIVDWLDATGGTRNGWRSMKEMAVGALDSCRSVGWLLVEDKDRLVVIPHISAEQGDGEIIIPRSWVSKITRIPGYDMPAPKKD